MTNKHITQLKAMEKELEAQAGNITVASAARQLHITPTRLMKNLLGHKNANCDYVSMDEIRTIDPDALDREMAAHRADLRDRSVKLLADAIGKESSERIHEWVAVPAMTPHQRRTIIRLHDTMGINAVLDLFKQAKETIV